MLRFKVGELAIYAFSERQIGARYVGRLLEIHAVGPFKAGTRLEHFTILRDVDYIILAQDGYFGAVKDYQLLKLDDPDQQVTQEVGEEITA